MRPMRIVNLAEKFAQFTEPWSPRIVGELNDSEVKLVKLQGEFVWHHHDHEDELFFVISGTLRMRLHTGDLLVSPGEFLIIPRGVEHCPVAETAEVQVMLLEPKNTLNTGNLQNERTVANPQIL